MSHESTGTGASRGPLTRTAVWSATHPWIALTAWALLIAATFAISFVTDTRQATETEMLTGESQRAARLVEAAGRTDPAAEFILLTRSDGSTWNLTGEQSALEHVRRVLADARSVQEVIGPILSADGTAVIFQVLISGDPDTATDRIEPLREAVTALQRDFPAATIQQTGAASIGSDFDQWLGDALDTAAVFSIPATLLILLVAFGAWTMSLIPILVGAAAVLSALGLWAVTSRVIPDYGLVPHVILLIGLAVGVDYALFYLRRYREERHAGHGADRATIVAARTAGHSIIVSGIAVALAMAGLLLMRETLFAGIAIGAILVVFVAMLSSVTAMPALMRLLDRWIDRPRVPFVWRLTNNGQESRRLRRALRPVVRHPWVALTVSTALLGLMALPAVGMKLASTTLDDYPRTLTSLQSYDALHAAFPETTSSARVVLTANAGKEERLRGAAEAIASQTERRPDPFGTPAAPWLSADGRTIVLDIPVPHQSASDEAQNAVRMLRTQIVPTLAVRSRRD